MLTIGARVWYALFSQNIFVTALTFHAGWVAPVITYPWGSENHKDSEAPDYAAMR